MVLTPPFWVLKHPTKSQSGDRSLDQKIFTSSYFFQPQFSNSIRAAKMAEIVLSAILQAVLEEAEDQQVTNKAVRTWLFKLKNATYNAEDVLDKLTALSRKLNVQEPHQILGTFQATQVKLDADEVRKMLQELEALAMECSVFHLRQDDIVTVQSDKRETGPFILESEIFGRKEDKEKIVKLLLSKEVNVSFIPVIGIGGLGKKKLAQLAYNDEEVMIFMILRFRLYQMILM
ncbi:disease resistance protein RGA2 [Ricinus communis]|uniref:disease resistance protein RGA2 n=1 Tax=Ricinus communis TaxID=3988 RepID=UPI00201B03C6|nr:disease resistance protein RGA2 [Ricinus communis]